MTKVDAETQTAHSPLPWRRLGPNTWHCIVAANDDHVFCCGHDYDEGGIFTSEADQDFVIRAVNTHEALVSALRIADDAMNPPDRGGISLHDWNQRLKLATVEIRAALQKATEGT